MCAVFCYLAKKSAHKAFHPRGLYSFQKGAAQQQRNRQQSMARDIHRKETGRKDSALPPYFNIDPDAALAELE